MTQFLPLPTSLPPNPRSVRGPDGTAGPDRMQAGKDLEIRQTAQRLEASFIAEMLKSAGFGEQENSFSGSSGEDQFASFQREALAQRMVQAGGIGLAEAFYKSMTETKNDT